MEEARSHMCYVTQYANIKTTQPCDGHFVIVAQHYRTIALPSVTDVLCPKKMFDNCQA